MVDDLFVVRLDPDVKLPARKSDGAAGYDLYNPGQVRLKKGEIVKVFLKVAVAVPKGHVGRIHGRSSLEAGGLHTLAGVIDQDYRGELVVVFKNLTQAEIVLPAGDRICQLVVYPIATPPVSEVNELPATDRGEGGFGSTGQ